MYTKYCTQCQQSMSATQCKCNICGYEGDNWGAPVYEPQAGSVNGTNNPQDKNVSKKMPNVQRISTDLSDTMVVSVERADNKSGAMDMQKVLHKRKRIKEQA